jgi:hypothetical protein
MSDEAERWIDGRHRRTAKGEPIEAGLISRSTRAHPQRGMDHEGKLEVRGVGVGGSLSTQGSSAGPRSTCRRLVQAEEYSDGRAKRMQNKSTPVGRAIKF